MLLGCLKTLQRPYQILDWYWALAFLWQNNNIAKCADGRDGKPHSKGSKFLVSKCLHCFSPDWLEKPPHSSHFPKWYWKKHQKPFVRQMSRRSWEKVAVKYHLSICQYEITHEMTPKPRKVKTSIENNHLIYLSDHLTGLPKWKYEVRAF